MSCNEDVRKYYTDSLQSVKDLKTGVCFSHSGPPPPYIRKLLSEVHPDVLARFYGCGLPIPSHLFSCKIVDIGCGAGRDCFILSKLVGSKGYVVGLDMTESMLEVARRYTRYHKEKFNLPDKIVDFVNVNIEKPIIGTHLALTPLTYDVAISNCVVNLTVDKRAALSNVFQLLRNGGEFYFCDVFSSQPVLDVLRKDKVLWGECISGALYWRDFYSLCEEIGYFAEFLVSATVINLSNEKIESRIVEECRKAGVEIPQLASCTFRVVKVNKEVTPRQDCLYRATYRGGIIEGEQELEAVQLDFQHSFPKGKTTSCHWRMAMFIESSRFAPFFELKKDKTATAKEDISVDPFSLLQSADKKAAGCCQSKCC